MMSKKKLGLLSVCVFTIITFFYVFGSKWIFERKYGGDLVGSAIFFEGFASLQTAEDVSKLLLRKGDKWNLIDETQFTGTSFRPSFSESIYLTPYEHLGYSGDLKFFFHNHRLFQISFHPFDGQDYLKVLNNRSGYDLKIGDKIKINENAVIECRKDINGRLYFLWYDKRIEEEVREWIRRFSSAETIHRGSVS